MDQSQLNKEKFQAMVEEVSPNSHLLLDCIKAFAVGGFISVIGEAFNHSFMALGTAKDEASMYTSIVLIFAGALLTGLGVYDKIGLFAGAGSAVPITGFANAITAPAIEFKKEGYILGVGARMFIVAGPVIVYGIVTSIIVGILYYFMK